MFTRIKKSNVDKYKYWITSPINIFRKVGLAYA